ARLRQGGTLSESKISIFIPAYNAADHLEGVIRRIPADVWPRILTCWIINDGSRDTTQLVADRLCDKNKKIGLICFEQNRGYGAVIKEGLRLCKRDGCDIAVCLHSDGQYPPEAIPRFARTMENGSYAILQGSRIASGTALSGGMPLYKYIAGRALTFLENMAFGLQMTDYHSGFLIYSRQALDAIPFERLSTSFDFDLEVIASARARGMKVGELPIPTRYAQEISYLNPITYGLRVLRVLVRYLTGHYGVKK
ncbi:MAG: glycosyltransferase family 2 protein, partial [Chitinivibrionales bacterium]